MAVYRAGVQVAARRGGANEPTVSGGSASVGAVGSQRDATSRSRGRGNGRAEIATGLKNDKAPVDGRGFQSDPCGAKRNPESQLPFYPAERSK